MHEVEVKAAVRDKEGLIARLAERGCTFGPEITQDDTVYVRETGTLDTYLANDAFLRLRVENDGRTHFAYKTHKTRETRASDPNAAPLELEVLVDSRETMESILLFMGYQEALRIKKIRRKGTYENWEVCLDEVQGLGLFIELEELTDDLEAVANIQKRMKDFLDELSLDGTSEIRDRYDILLLRKQYDQ